LAAGSLLGGTYHGFDLESLWKPTVWLVGSASCAMVIGSAYATTERTARRPLGGLASRKLPLFLMATWRAPLLSPQAPRTAAGFVVGIAAVVAAGRVVVQGKSAQEQADRKGAKPALEFTQADVVRLQQRRLAVETELPGTVQAVSQAIVRAKVAAEVKRVLVREGDKVEAGQKLAEFDTATLRAQLAERSAGLQSARAELATAKRTRDANEQLLKQNFISQNAYDTTDGAYQTRLASVELVKAQLQQTQIMLNDAVVRAPISGIICKRDDRAHLVEILSGVQASEDVLATKFDNLQHGLPARIKGLGGAQVVEPLTPNARTPG